MHEGNGFSAKIFRKSRFHLLTGPAMVRPASSDKWKAPYVSKTELASTFTKGKLELRLLIPNTGFKPQKWILLGKICAKIH